jgi:GNAT superfamily N-acetyltransferase
MTTVRELDPGMTILAVPALLELRPAWADADTLVRRIDEVQRPQGYRIVASFEVGEEDAAAVAGFRVVENLAWSRTLYVDDLVTRSHMRSHGHADRLFTWLEAEAQRQSCDEFHLDSGVGPHRQPAHRFYFAHGMRIASFHFSKPAPTPAPH